MDEKTLTALRSSIAKWEAIVAGTGINEGRTNCPLCQLFFNDDTLYQDACKGCPVHAKTNEYYCSGTPYNDYIDAEPEEQHRFAEEELEFLKSLLPS